MSACLRLVPILAVLLPLSSLLGGCEIWDLLLRLRAGLEEPITVYPQPPLDCAGTGRVIIEDCPADEGYEVIELRGAPGTPRVLVAGIYEARSDHSGADYHPTGTVHVHVRGNGPVIAVLSSYEPVLWNVTADEGVELQRVVLRGYQTQTAIVPEGVPVDPAEPDGPHGYGDDSGGGETDVLLASAETAADAEVTAFAGCYRATSITLETCDHVEGAVEEPLPEPLPL